MDGEKDAVGRLPSGEVWNSLRDHHEHEQALRDAQLQRAFQRNADAGDTNTTFASPQECMHVGTQVARVTNEDLEKVAMQIGRNQRVQSHGALLLVEPTFLKVLAVSDSIMSIMGVPYTDMLDQSLDELLHPETLVGLSRALQGEELVLHNPFLVRLHPSLDDPTHPNHMRVLGVIHRTEQGLIIDLEVVNLDDSQRVGLMASHRVATSVLPKLLAVKQLDQLSQIMAEEVFRLLGYDRVMIYKFHEDQHGEVVAAKSAEGVPSYMGLHWPATDLPQVNRKLFVEFDAPRLINDFSSEDSVIHMVPSMQGPVAIESSQLRAPVGCHKQYMENMGVRGSLVSPVVVHYDGTDKKRLWGLVVCHNLKSHYVPYSTRSALSLLVRVFGTKVQQALEMEHTAYKHRASSAESQLLDLVLSSSAKDRNLVALLGPKIRTLLSIVPASSVFMLRGDEYCAHGRDCLDQQSATDLVKWLAEQNLIDCGSVFSTENLFKLGYPNAKKITRSCAGVLVIQVAGEMEIRHEIQWAGAKDAERDVMSDGSKQLVMGPRNSFDVFVELSADSCDAWKPNHIKDANSLRVILLDVSQNRLGSLLKADLVSVIKRQRMKSVGELSKMASDLDVLMENVPMGTMIFDEDFRVERLNKWMLAKLGYSSHEDVNGTPLNQIVVESSYSELDLSRESHNVYLTVISATGEHLSLLGDFLPYKTGVSGTVVICQETSHHPSMSVNFLLDNMQSALFGMDSSMNCVLWNQAMKQLTGIHEEHVFGKSILHEVFSCASTGLLQMQRQESALQLEVALLQVQSGQKQQEDLQLTVMVGERIVDLLLNIRKAEVAEGSEVAVLFFTTDVSLRRALEMAETVRLVAESAVNSKTQTISFLCHEIRNPLNGIMCSTALMSLEKDRMEPLHQELLESTESCASTLRRLVDDVLDMTRIEQGKLELVNEPFNILVELHSALQQVAMACTEKGLDLVLNTSELHVTSMIGDHMRLQQTLTNLLWNAVKYTQNGCVKLAAKSAIVNDVVDLSIAVIDTGEGIDDHKMETLFGAYETEQRVNKFGSTGLGLHIAQTVAARMGGYIECTSEVNNGSTFTIKLPCQPTSSVVSTSIKKTAGDNLFHMSPALAKLHASGAKHTIGGLEQSSKTAHDGGSSNSRSAAADYSSSAAPSRSVSQTEGYFVPSRNTSASSTGTVRRSFEGAKAPTAVKLPQQEPKMVERQQMHVLVIDDQEFNLRLLQTCLQRLHYKVTTDSKVLDALQLLTTGGDITLEDGFDVVMVDEMMPAMLGSEMTQRLRKFELSNRLPHLPVICVTANTSPEDRIRYANRGVDAVINKPLQLRKLGEDLRTFMQLYASGAPLDVDCGQLVCVHQLRTSGAVVPAKTAGSAMPRKARNPVPGDTSLAVAKMEAAGSGERGNHRWSSADVDGVATTTVPSEGVGKAAQQKWMMSMLIQQQQEQMKTMNGQMAVMKEMCDSNLQMMRQILDQSDSC